MSRDAHATATLIGLSRAARRNARPCASGGRAVIYDLPTYVASGSRTLAAAEAAMPTLAPDEELALQRVLRAVLDDPGPEAA